MKTILNYFKQRRECKLRQWCAATIPKQGDEYGSFVHIANSLYYWVTTGDIEGCD